MQAITAPQPQLQQLWNPDRAGRITGKIVGALFLEDQQPQLQQMSVRQNFKKFVNGVADGFAGEELQQLWNPDRAGRITGRILGAFTNLDQQQPVLLL